MTNWLSNVFMVVGLLAGIIFFGVMIWAMVYTIVNLFKEENRHGKRN